MDPCSSPPAHHQAGAGPEAGAGSDRPRTPIPWRALPVLMAGTFMIVLDFFIVNVALPSMQSRLHASTSALEWVVAGYGLAFSTMLITAGRLGDQIGRRRLFDVGLALFVSTSAACGLAPNPDLLVAARVLQGVAAALISPTVLSIIGVTFTGPDRVRAISIYGVVHGPGRRGRPADRRRPDPGGPLGPRLAQRLSHQRPGRRGRPGSDPRWLTESRAPTQRRLDLVGTVILTAGLVAVVLPLIQGRQLGLAGVDVGQPGGWLRCCWGDSYSTSAGLAAAGGAPLLDLALFRDRSLQRRVDHPVGTVVRTGVLFPGAGPLPPARERDSMPCRPDWCSPFWRPPTSPRRCGPRPSPSDSAAP